MVRSNDALEGTVRIGWLGGRGLSLDPASFYPLHPSLLPVMVRFFSQFGQSERSLFGFLLSSTETGTVLGQLSVPTLLSTWALHFVQFV
jgi:hypothetical protein